MGLKESPLSFPPSADLPTKAAIGARTLVRVNCQLEVEDVGWVWEDSLDVRRQVQLRDI
jgi:hypothetical protein